MQEICMTHVGVWTQKKKDVGIVYESVGIWDFEKESCRKLYEKYRNLALGK